MTDDPRARKLLAPINEALGLFPSAIKSGENWSGTCEVVLINAQNAVRLVTRALASPQDGGERAALQQRVQPWMMECFGPEIAADRVERNHRFLEEALELVQALGCTQSEAHQLVDYTYGRAEGEPTQEVGGVMVTLAALCLANGFDMHGAGETELARISEPAIIEKIRAKQAAKPPFSPLPSSPAAQPERSEFVDGYLNAAQPVDEDEVERIAQVREALIHAANTFYRYARLHQDKGTSEGDRKACANAGMGEEMHAALAHFDVVFASRSSAYIRGLEDAKAVVLAMGVNKLLYYSHTYAAAIDNLIKSSQGGAGK